MRRIGHFSRLALIRALIALFALFVVFVFLFWFLYPKIPQKAEIGGQVLELIVAKSDYERTLGLSGMSNLPENSAMLFIFQKESLAGIWMKDMLFPIDIFWLDSSLRIIHIEKNVSPDSFPQIFNPESKALYVLETNSGLADKNEIQVNDIVRFVR
jgi:uncharacterized membrane protein (UPF0127 family)